MPRMERDAQDRCLRKDGGIAGQSRNAKFPRRDTPWQLRTTVANGEAYDAMIRAAGYSSRPDALLKAFALYAAFLGIDTSVVDGIDASKDEDDMGG